jgi:hypothetical protein
LRGRQRRDVAEPVARPNPNANPDANTHSDSDADAHPDANADTHADAHTHTHARRRNDDHRHAAGVSPKTLTVPAGTRVTPATTTTASTT